MLKYMTLITAGFILVSNAIFAETDSSHEQLRVPQCLAQRITISHEVLAENDQFQIIDVLSSEMGNLNRLADQVNCGDFVNISHHLKGIASSAKKQSAQSLLANDTGSFSPITKPGNGAFEIKHSKEVNKALKTVVADNIWQTLNHLTSYANRSATKDTGVEAANWLKSTFEAMAIEYSRTDTDTFFVKTGWYKQPSLVTVIGKNLKEPAIIIGAHMDTPDGLMPGADDGSGSATIMEAARVLLASKIKLNRPVYIVWYAAGTRKLAGSQYVVHYFQDKNIPVKAVVQFDMTGYRAKVPAAYQTIYTDYTDKGLSQYMAKLIDTYIHVPVDYSECGYECSDHASWNEEGISTAFPSESNFEDRNPYIHSSSDTMDLLNLNHMTNF
ncbi:MAG: M28 family peptidase, partial [Gammaproteobacteria bacterium]|nr:M28 family peptidase [Gammaproteobacteria bacterium]